MNPLLISDFAFAMLINAALLLAIMQLWTLSQARTWSGLRWLTLLLPSVAGVLVMRATAVLAPGIVFDSRSVVLAISGLFLGPLPTAIAVACTAVYRLQMGGTAAGVGIGVIFTSALIGIGLRALWRKPLANLTWRQILPMAYAVQLTMLAWMLALPGNKGPEVIAAIAWPVLTIHPLLTLALGMIMVDALRRQEEFKALEARELLYGELFRGSRAVMLLVSEENDAILDVNRAAESFYGWSREELLAKRFADLDASGDAMQAYTAIEGRLGQPWLHRFELRHKRADRSVRDVEVFHTRIYIGTKPALFLILHDISDRLSAERSLQELERIQREDQAAAQARQEEARRHTQQLMEEAIAASERLQRSLAVNQALINNSPLPIFSMDLQGIISVWNPAAERTFGWPAQEAVGKPNPLIPPDKLEEFAYLRDQLRQGKVFIGLERERICRDGRRIPVNIHAAPIIDGSGATLGIVAMVEDISARKAAEADMALQASRAQSLLALPEAAERLPEQQFLQESLRLTEALTGSSISFLHLVSADQREVELCAWSARTLEEYCHAAYDAHYPVDQAGIWVEPIRTLKPYVINDYPSSPHPHALPTGHAHLERMVVVPVVEHGRVVLLLGLGNRATAYRELEVESAQLMADATWRLVHARRNATAMAAEVAERRLAQNASRAKSAFLANMSHEIRTPLNAILGLVQLLQRDIEVPKWAERLEKVAGAARHLLSIINDILDLSKIEAGRMELEQTPFSVQQLLDHVAELIAEPAAAKGLQVNVQPHGELPWVRGDVTRVRQALINYAGNAVKFTARGFIQLSARAVPIAPGRVELRIEVTDSGIGIEPRHLARLFQPFEQADTSPTREYGGTGLGLAITRSLAQMMNGDAGCSSVSGRGSCFWFTFQAEEVETPKGEAALAQQARPAAPSWDSSARVLLVEDNEINREVALELLRSEGLQVSVAVDGAEAVEQVTAQTFDLVLMDVQMPKMDGLTATRAIRQLPGREAMPIVAMTANAFAQDRAACLAAGMNDFVAKPFEISDVLAILRRWLPAATSLSQRAQPVPAELKATPQWQRWTAVPGLEPPYATIARLPRWQSYELLLQQFAERHAQAAAEGPALLERRDLEGLRQFAHSVKGAAWTLGLRVIGQLSAALEVACAAAQHGDPQAPGDGRPAERDTGELTTLCSALTRELRAFGACVESWRADDTPAAAQASNTDPGRAREIAQIVAHLEELLSLSDTQVWHEQQVHVELLQSLLGPAHGPFSAALGKADFAGALAILRQLSHKEEFLNADSREP